jgi:uncharacterized integral membrane protein
MLADPPPNRLRQEHGIDAASAEARGVRRRTAVAGFAAGVVVTVAVALLIVQNTHDTEIEWLVFSRDAATWLVMLLTFLAGGLATSLLWLAWSRRVQRDEGDSGQAG